LDEDTGKPENFVGSVGSLTVYTQELGRALRKAGSIRQVRERDLDITGKTWTNRKTGEALELIREYVDPVDPAASLAVAYVVRDGVVCFLKPLGARHQPDKSVHIGSLSGSRVA
jgi:hypothetical protein